MVQKVHKNFLLPNRYRIKITTMTYSGLAVPVEEMTVEKEGAQLFKPRFPQLNCASWRTHSPRSRGITLACSCPASRSFDRSSVRLIR